MSGAAVTRDQRKPVEACVKTTQRGEPQAQSAMRPRCRSACEDSAVSGEQRRGTHAGRHADRPDTSLPTQRRTLLPSWTTVRHTISSTLPAGPAGTGGPAGPVAPAGPVSPPGPAGPGAPASPDAPAGPCSPSAPPRPSLPVPPCGPCSPRGPCGPLPPDGPWVPARRKIAITSVEAVTFTSHVAPSPTRLQPIQPANSLPLDGASVKTTTPGTNSAVHAPTAPQLIPAGLEVTVPLPYRTTDSETSPGAGGVLNSASMPWTVPPPFLATIQ